MAVRSWQEVEQLPEFKALDDEAREALRNDYFKEVIAPDLPTAQIAEAWAQFDGATRPPARNKSFMGDVPDLLKKGLYQAGGGLLDFVRADTPAQWLYDQAKAQEETMTPATVQALAQPLFSEEGDYYLDEGATSPRAWLAQGIETVGGMALPVPGGTLARAAIRPLLGMGRAAQALQGTLVGQGVAAGQAGRMARRLAPDWRDTAATVAGYGGMEGLVSAGLAEQQTREQVLTLPQATLEQAPPYWAAMQETGGDPQAARQLLAENLGKEAGWKTLGPTVALGAVAGRYYDKLIGGGGTGSRLKNTFQGGAVELMQEAPQSGAETLAQNTTLQQVDPTIETTANLIPNMLTGAALGGLAGGAMAGVMPKGTLERAVDAGGQADANGLPVQPAPSPGEVNQQQQEQGLQQQEAQRQAVEQQRRDALAAEKAAQAAEKTRQAQLKTQQAELGLINAGGAPGAPIAGAMPGGVPEAPIAGPMPGAGPGPLGVEGMPPGAVPGAVAGPTPGPDGTVAVTDEPVDQIRQTHIAQMRKGLAGGKLTKKDAAAPDWAYVRAAVPQGGPMPTDAEILQLLNDFHNGVPLPAAPGAAAGAGPVPGVTSTEGQANVGSLQNQGQGQAADAKTAEVGAEKPAGSAQAQPLAEVWWDSFDYSDRPELASPYKQRTPYAKQPDDTRQEIDTAFQKSMQERIDAKTAQNQQITGAGINSLPALRARLDSVSEQISKNVTTTNRGYNPAATLEATAPDQAEAVDRLFALVTEKGPKDIDSTILRGQVAAGKVGLKPSAALAESLRKRYIKSLENEWLNQDIGTSEGLQKANKQREEYVNLTGNDENVEQWKQLRAERVALREQIADVLAEQYLLARRGFKKRKPIQEPVGQDALITEGTPAATPAAGSGEASTAVAEVAAEESAPFKRAKELRAEYEGGVVGGTPGKQAAFKRKLRHAAKRTPADDTQATMLLDLLATRVMREDEASLEFGTLVQQPQGDAAPAEPIAAPVETGAPFDSVAWRAERDARIKAARERNAPLLDTVESAVETMRGRQISYLHGDEKGVITTVDNDRFMYVKWQTGPQAGQTGILSPSDAKDYEIVGQGWGVKWKRDGSNDADITPPKQARAPRVAPAGQGQPPAGTIDIRGQWDGMNADQRREMANAAGLPGGRLANRPGSKLTETQVAKLRGSRSPMATPAKAPEAKKPETTARVLLDLEPEGGNYHPITKEINKAHRWVNALSDEDYAALAQAMAGSRQAPFPHGAATNLAPEQVLSLWQEQLAKSKQRGGTALEVEGAPAAGAAPNERPADWGANNTLVSRERAEELRKRLKAKLAQLNAGMDPEVMLIGTELAVFHIEAGVRRFADLARQLAADLDEPLERLRPYLRSWYNGARDMMEDSGLDVAGMDDPDTVKTELGALFATTLKTETTEEQTDDQAGAGATDQGGERQGGGGPVRTRRDDTGRDDRAVAGDQAPDGGGPGAAGDTGGVRAPDTGAAGGDGRPLSGGGDGLAGQPGAGQPGLADLRTRNRKRPARRRGAAAGDGGAGASTADGEAGGGADTAEPSHADTLAASATNFHADDPLRIYGGTPKERFRKNQRAIELYRQLEETGRAATLEEKETLAGYTGFGSFGQDLFQGTWERAVVKDGWEAENEWLRNYLGESEWKAAQASIINAHYTDPPSVQAIWEAVRQLGFTGGRVLEPSAGIGNFFAMMPLEIQRASKLTGIELDELTAGMLKQLYPEANIQQKPYQDSQTPDNFYDLVIGNWPFSSAGPADRRYNALSPSLHDYFFLKALDQVRPGGLVVGITSRYTLDGKAGGVRQALARKADLVAAFRLPSGAFEEYAGTKVVTDVLILQKRTEDETNPSQIAWTQTQPMTFAGGDQAAINRYYHEHPEQVLGTLDWGSGTTYGRAGVIVQRPEDLEARLAQVVERLPTGLYQPARNVKAQRYLTNNTQERHRAVVVGPDGGLYQIQGERMVALEDATAYKIKDAKKTAAREAQVRALVGMRQAYGSLIDAERDGAPGVEDLRKTLKGQYDAFVAAHGPVRKSAGMVILKRVEDPFYPSLMALEREKDGVITPMPILERSVMRRPARLDNPSIQDAYVLARNQGMVLDMDAIAKLAKVTPEAAAQGLIQAGAIFRTPEGGYEPADVYLRGNVRRKLREAQAAAEQGEDMAHNIAELEKVIPPTVPYFNIEARLGAQWVAPRFYRDFVAEELLGVPEQADNLEVEWRVNRWVVKPEDGLRNTAAAVRWRTIEARNADGQMVDQEVIPFRQLVETAFNNGTMRFTAKGGDGNVYVREELTAAANEKAGAIREAFEEWVWKAPERKVALERDYNEVMNSIANPKFDGSFLAFEGMALQRGDDEFSLRSHQSNAIWRGLVQGAGLFAHEVGTGKTYTMAGIAVESRRFGLAKKPLILAHNANSASVAAEIQEMYPGAKVLYVNNLQPSRVKETLAQIRNDDWDAVVMPHSLLDRLTLKGETLEALAAEEIAALEAAFWEAMLDTAEGMVRAQVGVNRLDSMLGGESILDDEDAIRKLRNPTAKELATARLKIKERIRRQAQESSRPDAVTFEDLGVDMLMVDEAHLFKKPPMATRMKMRGLQKQMSNRSVQLKFLTDYIKNQNGGRGVHLFTGTPITNTLAEIFHMQRYVMHGEMKRDGIGDWDSWFNTFATGVSDVEFTAAGDYQPVTKLAGFINVAELRRMMSPYMDVVFADDMPEFTPRLTASGKTLAAADLTEAERDYLLNGREESPVGRPYRKVVMDVAEMSPEQQAILEHLQNLAEEWRNASGMTRRDWMLEGDPHSPIMIEGAAARAGMDARMEDLALPDYPANKINRAVGNIMRHYLDEPMAGQVVFMDKGYSDTRTVRGERVPGLNLAKELRAKLMAAGIPEKEIAIVAGGVTPEQKKAVADAVNAGKIRVVIGQTETLGTGVNMQQRLRAMHHLDAPWMPGELEQRNGRGWRQGNSWNTVMEYRYITERIDGKRWQVLAVKDRFIKAFLQANADTRVIEGDAVSDEEGGYAETLSEAVGDPRLLQRQKLRADLDKLNRRERTHAQGIVEARENLARNKRAMPRKQALVAGYRGDAEVFAEEEQAAAREQEAQYRERLDAYLQSLDLELTAAERAAAVARGWGNKQPDRELAKRVRAAVLAAEADGRPRPSEPTTQPFAGQLLNDRFTTRDEMTEALKSLGQRMPQGEPGYVDVGEIFGFPLQAKRLDRYTVELYLVSRTNDQLRYRAWSPNATTIVTETLRALRRHADGIQREIEAAQRDQEKLEELAKQPFARAEELARKRARLEEIETDMALNPVPAPAWLRHGAPLDSQAFWRGKPVVVEGHQWSDDGYFVHVLDGEKSRRVPYLEIQDANGAPVYEPHDFTAPVTRAAVTTPGESAGPVIEVDGQEGDAPAFRKRGGAATGASPAALRAAVARIVAPWAKTPEVVVFSGMTDAAVPAAVRARYDAQVQARREADPQAQGDVVDGFWYRGVVYVNAEAVGNRAALERVLRHEALGHGGLRGLFGADLVPLLDRLIRARRAEVAAKAKAYGLDMADPQQARQAAEEVLAELAQTRPEIGFVRQLVALIKAKLREWGVLDADQMSDAEILREYVIPARNFIERGQVQAPGMKDSLAVAFMRRGTEAAGEGQGGALPATLTIDGIERPTMNSEGRPIHPTEEGVRNFWKAFGESKGVDGQGRPLVVYHGTNADFSIFDISKSGSSSRFGPGFYFSGDRRTLDTYGGGDGGNVMPVHLDIKSPQVGSALTKTQIKAFFGALQDKVFPNGYDATEDHKGFMRQALKNPDGAFDILLSAQTAYISQADWLRGMDAMGVDGIIMEVFGYPEYVVFKPTQIKSAIGNTGAYSMANEDIRFSLSPAAGGSPLGDQGGAAFLNKAKTALGHRWTQALGSREASPLALLTLRQLGEVGAKWLPGVGLYNKLRTRMETRRNVMMEESGRLADAMESWARRHAVEARQVWDLANDSTLAQVDPSDYQVLRIPLQLGPGREFLRNWAATAENVAELKRRVTAWRKSSNTREREMAAYYDAAARKLAKAVRWEAKRQAALPALQQRWAALSEGKTHLDTGGAPFATEVAARAAQAKLPTRLGAVYLIEEVTGGWAIQELGGQDIFVRMRDLYQKRSKEMMEALIERLNSLESLDEASKATLAARIRAEFENPLDAKGNPRIGPYFPLQRFGNFYLFARRYPEGAPRTFQRQDGQPFPSEKAAWAASAKRADLRDLDLKVKPLDDGTGFVLEERGEEGFWLFESVAERSQVAAELGGEGWAVVRLGLTQEASRELEGVSEGFVADAVTKLKEQGSAEEADTLYQMYLNTLQQMSIRKRFIHRKGTKGYTADVLRSFAWNMTRQAHQISKLEGMPKLEKLLRDIEEGIKTGAEDQPDQDTTRQTALLIELKKRHEHLAKPDGSALANMLSALGFMFYLGVSPAAALVNLSQVPIVALPELAARYGSWGAAAKGLSAAFVDVARGFSPAVMKGFVTGRPLPSDAANLTEEERAAFVTWSESGVRDRTQAHNLAGIAEADSLLNGPTMNRVMGAVSSLFHAAEVLNRDATLLAAFRLARAKGIDPQTAAMQAEEATWASHFDYCVPTDTEMLTTRGWKRFDEIAHDDVAIAVDDAGRAVESEILEVNVFRGPKRVVEFSHGQRRLAFAATAAHEHIVCTHDSKTKQYGRLRKVRTDQLSQSTFLLRAPRAGIDRPGRVGTDFAALLGWVAAEGWYAKFRGCKHKSDVRLEQSQEHNPTHVATIRSLLDRLGGEYREYPSKSGKHRLWVIRGQLRKDILAVMPDNLLNAEMLSLFSADEMRALLIAFAAGDGHRKKNNIVISQGGRTVGNLNILQAMATTCGMVATMGAMDRMGRQTLNLNDGEWRSGHHSQIKQMDRRELEVDDVWCPTTAHGTWIARRNGAVVVTGNSNANRARVMQGNVAKTLLMFKNYAQHVLYFMGRNLFLWAKGESPEVRREARTKFTGMMGMTALFAGAAGLPIGGVFVMANAMQALFGDDDEPWDAEVEFRNWLAATFPDPVAGMIDRGAVTKLSGLDFASRVSIRDLLWRAPDRDLDGKGMYQHVVEQLLGPIGGLAARPFTMADEVAEGNWARAAEAMVPKFARDLLQAGRYGMEGVTTRQGYPVMQAEELSSYELFWKALGMQPDELAVRWDANSATKLYEGRIMDRRKALITAAALAMIHKDAATLRLAREEIAAFNKANPEVKIVMSTLTRSVRGRNTMRERAQFGVLVNPKLARLRQTAGGFGYPQEEEADDLEE